mmetsp:Transcript_87443/g.234167  ORF Transcript_87443/g.234167 Transcript_87443/m.234167 type:complete len:84 (+) Transcript_87443:2082-2333(+)
MPNRTSYESVNYQHKVLCAGIFSDVGHKCGFLPIRIRGDLQGTTVMISVAGAGGKGALCATGAGTELSDSGFLGIVSFSGLQC